MWKGRRIGLFNGQLKILSLVRVGSSPKICTQFHNSISNTCWNFTKDTHPILKYLLVNILSWPRSLLSSWIKSFPLRKLSARASHVTAGGDARCKIEYNRDEHNPVDGIVARRVFELQRSPCERVGPRRLPQWAILLMVADTPLGICWGGSMVANHFDN